MRDRSKPSPVPSLIPFVVIALLLIVIYLGFLAFPMIKSLVNHQDCVASGRDDCYPHSIS